MNQGDFNEWWDYHTTRNPSHQTWVIESAKGLETLEAWRNSLGAISLTDAKQASDAIMSGHQVCYGAEGLIRAMEDWCQHASSATYSRNPPSPHRPETFDCHHCRDLGVRQVFHPSAMRAVMKWPVDLPVEKKGNPVLSRVCNVACKCKAGDSWENPAAPPKGKKRPSPLPRFKRNLMVPIAGSSPTEDDIAALVEHIEKALQHQTARYDEFAEWNQA